MNCCFLFGHRNCPTSILPKLEAAIASHYINYGARLFYVGSRGSFDQLATTALKNAKKRFPDIQLHLVLAYHPAERPVNLTPGFDGSFYPPLENVPRQYAIVRANQYMVDFADCIICYAAHPGNARNLWEHAQKRQIPIENIAQSNYILP